MPDLAAGGAWTRVRLRWRQDPLTGASARILTGVKLQPPTRPDLTELTAKPAFCPFDAEHLETATVPFPAELTAEGRIRLGRAVVVPNIMAYATHSAVGIYDPGVTSSTWTTDAVPRRGRPDRHGPPCPDGAAPGPHRRVEFDQRQLPAALGRLTGPSAPPVRSRRLRPDRPAPAGREVRGVARDGRVLLGRPGRPGGRRPRWAGQYRPGGLADPFAPTGFHEVWGVVNGAAM